MTAPRQTGLPLEGKAPPASWSNPDAVYTPTHLARFLVDLLPWDGVVHRVLEPSAGRGAWVEAVVARHLERFHDLGPPLDVVGVDLDPHCGAADPEGMARRLEALAHRGPGVPALRGLDRIAYRFQWGDVLALEDLGQFDRVIGNPPYSAIPDHVDRGLELAREVAFLLPLDLLGGGEEIPTWLARSPLRAYWPLRQRPWPKKLRGTAFYWWDRRLPPLEERLDEPIGFPPLDWKAG